MSEKNMSKTFNEREEEIKNEKEEQVAEKANAGLKYFWAPATNYQIGNFHKEKRDGSGRVETPEESVRFDSHMKITSDEEVIAYIKSTGAFRSGKIKECGTMAEALQLTAQHNKIKLATREERAEVQVMEVITDG